MIISRVHAGLQALQFEDVPQVVLMRRGAALHDAGTRCGGGLGQGRDEATHSFVRSANMSTDACRLRATTGSGSRGSRPGCAAMKPCTQGGFSHDSGQDLGFYRRMTPCCARTRSRMNDKERFLITATRVCRARGPAYAGLLR